MCVYVCVYVHISLTQDNSKSFYPFLSKFCMLFLGCNAVMPNKFGVWRISGLVGLVGLVLKSQNMVTLTSDVTLTIYIYKKKICLSVRLCVRFFAMAYSIDAKILPLTNLTAASVIVRPDFWYWGSGVRSEQKMSKFVSQSGVRFPRPYRLFFFIFF